MIDKNIDYNSERFDFDDLSKADFDELVQMILDKGEPLPEQAKRLIVWNEKYNEVETVGGDYKYGWVHYETIFTLGDNPQLWKIDWDVKPNAQEDQMELGEPYKVKVIEKTAHIRDYVKEDD